MKAVKLIRLVVKTQDCRPPKIKQSILTGFSWSLYNWALSYNIPKAQCAPVKYTLSSLKCFYVTALPDGWLHVPALPAGGTCGINTSPVRNTGHQSRCIKRSPAGAPSNLLWGQTDTTIGTEPRLQTVRHTTRPLSLISRLHRINRQ